MVIRSANYPRLPRMYWGELIYATPGTGKTFVANKYRDVVDGDDLIVQAISELAPNFDLGYYDDPRTVIFRYFRYINFNRRLMWKVYNRAIYKMEISTNEQDTVLFGTMDLMHLADRMFLQQDDYYVRNGFQNKLWKEQENADDSQAIVHEIYEYLDNSLHRTCQNSR